ncbi:hypothetical protein ACFQZE_23855 [Paenibacillus sp. GCM10027627]|uniref:hypothetical protein n=1 Tax=unclassified Paenibacillus TaxID=185978 RepID=UPI003635ED2F
MTKTISIDEQLASLGIFFSTIMDDGMQGKAGAVWPLIVRNWGSHLDGTRAVHYYPSTFFQNLKMKYKVYLPDNTKAERLKALKYIIDKLMSGDIDAYLYHFGLYVLYHDPSSRRLIEDIESIGARRSEYLAALPRFELKNNDEFISEIWGDLIDRRYPEVGEEIVRVPYFNNLRILFTPEEFGAQTGRYYSDADWLEPIPGYTMEVRKWVGEKDPMTPEPKKGGMIEDYIHLVERDGSLRHYVSNKPIHAGSYIEVKFGDGWISGRYEWSFGKGEPISVCSNRDSTIYIREGHLVRVKA